VPAPRVPCTVTYTLYAPAAINQSKPLYVARAVGTGAASSPTGAPATPARQNTGRMITCFTVESAALRSCTITSARPGTTIGGRTTTRTGYGPASPSKITFGLPTCADAATAIAPTTRTLQRLLMSDLVFQSTADCRQPAPPEQAHGARQDRADEREAQAAREHGRGRSGHELVRPRHVGIARPVDVVVSVEEAATRRRIEHEKRGERPLHRHERREERRAEHRGERRRRDASAGSRSPPPARRARAARRATPCGRCAGRSARVLAWRGTVRSSTSARA